MKAIMALFTVALAFSGCSAGVDKNDEGATLASAETDSPEESKAQTSPMEFWQPLTTAEVAAVISADPESVTNAENSAIEYCFFKLRSIADLKSALRTAPNEPTSPQPDLQPLPLEMPLANGRTETCSVFHSSLTPPAIEERFDLRSYTGACQGTGATVSISTTPDSFSGQILGVSVPPSSTPHRLVIDQMQNDIYIVKTLKNSEDANARSVGQRCTP